MRRNSWYSKHKYMQIHSILRFLFSSQLKYLFSSKIQTTIMAHGSLFLKFLLLLAGEPNWWPFAVHLWRNQYAFSYVTRQQPAHPWLVSFANNKTLNTASEQFPKNRFHHKAYGPQSSMPKLRKYWRKRMLAPKCSCLDKTGSFMEWGYFIACSQGWIRIFAGSEVEMETVNYVLSIAHAATTLECSNKDEQWARTCWIRENRDYGTRVSRVCIVQTGHSQCIAVKRRHQRARTQNSHKRCDGIQSHRFHYSFQR